MFTERRVYFVHGELVDFGFQRRVELIVRPNRSRFSSKPASDPSSDRCRVSSSFHAFFLRRHFRPSVKPSFSAGGPSLAEVGFYLGGVLGGRKWPRRNRGSVVLARSRPIEEWM